MRFTFFTLISANLVHFAWSAPSNWVHPGVFLDAAQLAQLPVKVALKAEPWYTAYKQMTNSTWASLSRPATPFVSVDCGSNSNPNNGCTEERQDALAAYQMALTWVITLNTTYADKAIEYMNAWSPVIQAHTLSNAPLQTGWAGVSWARVGEIIKSTYRYHEHIFPNGWKDADIAQFGTMMRNVYLPTLLVGSNSNGNWELVMMEAAIGMAVFLEDGDVYDTAMTKFLGRVPAYIYLTTDGPYPLKAPDGNQDTQAKIIKYWQNQTTFVDGLAQETCRDFAHTGYGIASISAVAETARIQGTNLWTGDLGTRVSKALEFHTQFENGGAVPGWLCNGTVNLGLGPVTEPPYNALNTRLHQSLPQTKAFTERTRPQGTNYLFLAWETLTNAQSYF